MESVTTPCGWYTCKTTASGWWQYDSRSEKKIPICEEHKRRLFGVWPDGLYTCYLEDK